MTQVRNYEGDGITVQYELKRCIHAAECVNRLRAVFDTQKRPWIQPQHSDADTLAEVIVRCPSGALKYTRSDGGVQEMTPAATRIDIQADGPLYVHGDIRVVMQDTEQNETRMALCRCGASKNKPFCDNSHRDIAFQSDGQVEADQRRLGEEAPGGQVVFTPLPNGSIKVEGHMEIYDASGALIFRGDKTWLCRCGGSANKPFCDGTHKTIGFTTE